MTPLEVVYFCNHKYGESAYVVEDDNWVYLFTRYSKWLIKKSDFKNFGKYTLFHSNNDKGNGYHIQKHGRDLDFLVYEAVCHDAIEREKRLSFTDFKRSWELYIYGQMLYESVCSFEFLAN